MLDGAVFFAIIEEENEVIWMVQDRNPEYFLAIASEKSISKAAERLHISQLDLASGDLVIDGEIHALQYVEAVHKGKGAVARLFR